jgi:8-oxo-dGTP diphosphatase
MKPRIISSIVLRKDDKLLLVKEVLENFKEYWIFPGGGVEFGETIEEAAIREAKEETGLDVRIKEFLGFKEVIVPKYDYHTIIFFFIAEPLNHDIKTTEKILDAKYFSLDEMKELNLVDSAEWVLKEMNQKGLM